MFLTLFPWWTVERQAAVLLAEASQKSPSGVGNKSGNQDMIDKAQSTIPPDIRAQVERFMADPERCMPSERERLKQAGFDADRQPMPVASSVRKT